MFDRKTKTPGLIFIVEDNTIYAKTLELFLQDKFPSAKIKTFPVGELCLDNLHLNPDVIIMDYQLNSKYYDAADGLEMVEKIKASTQHVNIIVLSAQEDVKVAVTAMKDFKSHYVTKNENAFEQVAEAIQAGPLNK